MASGGYDKQRERLACYEEQGEEQMENEFVVVPRELKSYVIGKGGCVLHEIMQTSGAKVSSQSGLVVSGNKEQRACAIRLIEEKVQNVKSTMWEQVTIPDKYKGLVMGTRGAKLREISTQTGAKVIYNNKDGEVYITSGTDEQRKNAQALIGSVVSDGRIRGAEHDSNKVSRYIDGCNFSDAKLKLKQVPQEDCKGRPTGSHVQYRLKPAKENEPKESCGSESYSSYQPLLIKDVLMSMRRIKHKMGANSKADMRCYCGSAIIRIPREEKVEEREWSIDEAIGKFQSSTGENHWKLKFKEGVDLNKRIFREHYKEKTPEDVPYVTRHDLTFITPCMHQVGCKIWVANKNYRRTLDDIPRDINNLLGEINFKDKATRTLCRGWLELKSISFLQADILFPGCEFDCRFSVRGRTDSALATEGAPDEDVRNALLKFLSGLTLTEEDAFGLRFPEQDITEGFHLMYHRLSKQTEYTTDEGFLIIISEERTWNLGTEENRELTDVHLHCEEWDTLLSSGVWEPEDIVRKLPEFFEFLKEVQGTVSHEMERAVLMKTIPPEILARGPSAFEAYKKALAYGETSVKRFPLMLIGQDGAGKTSLKKSLKGVCYDPEEDSTVGIDVDPSHFKVSTETWRTGTLNQDDKNCDADISCDYHTALIMGKQIVNSVKEKRKNTEIEKYTDAIQYSFDSELNSVPGELRLTESSKDASEHIIQTSRDPETTRSRHESHVSVDPAEKSQEDSTTNVPEEVAAVAESLLRGDLDDNRDDIFSTFWDFAGQSVYYETHPLFLTAKAVCCLVYDLSLNPHSMAKPMVKQGVFKEKQETFNLKTNLDYLEFWMMSVASLASGEDECPRSELLPERLPPVFLVCTHADTPYDRRDPRKLSHEIFGFLKSKPYGVHLFDVFFVDNTSLRVNNTDCPEVVRLRQQILAVAKDLPHINEVIPIKWLQFEKMLQAVKKTGYKCISLETAEDIASQFCNIDKDKEFKTLMSYLHDLRCLINFNDTVELKKLIVLNPQWLVDVFKKVITVKPYNEGERKFIDLWRKLENDGILDEKLLTHVWGPLFSENSEKETSESLIEIMKKFCLLCPWPSDASSDKSYLVPSMLKSHPPKKIIQLTASAKIPSLFINFANGQVPPGFFPRLVLQFFEWGNEKLWRAGKPQLFHNFARFFTTKDDYSVILICHPSTIEVVVHGGNRNLELPDEPSTRMMLSTDFQYDAVDGFICTRVVSKLGLMLECMRSEFCWLRNIKYEMSVICPVCSRGKAVDYCKIHQTEECKEYQCLHFLTRTELCRSKEDIFCTRSASAQNTRVEVMQFEPWLSTQGQQLAVGKRDGRLVSSDGENREKVVALPDSVLESLLAESCDSEQVVCHLKERFQLDTASLEQPDAGTKQLIRCLARKAKCSNRLDVVKQLREITPAGTTGPLLPESRDVRRIPFTQARKLTIALSGGDEWMLVAEKLGLSPEEIRYLNKRTLNPAEALLCYIANQRYLTVGDLYEVLCDCGVPVMADEL